MKQVITNKMELKEEQPTSEIRQNKFEVYSEYNNLDLMRYLNHDSLFTRGYNDIELSHDTQCKSIQFIQTIEEENIHRQNNEIIYKQVNRKEINFRGPWNFIKNDETIFLNGICTVSPDSNYCSVDLNELLIFKRYVFYIMELLFNEKVNYSQRSETRLSIKDSQMPLKLRHPEHKGRKINHKLLSNRRKQLCNGEMKRLESLIPKEHYLLFDDIQRNDFAIPLERQCIDFRISISKYSMPNLFYTLTKMRNSCIPVSPDSASVDMFSPSVGNWYFLNISQGYSLKLLLRNVNVSTLSVMLQLYFILITHAHPNLSIQINFRMKPELLNILETLYLKPFSFKLVDWSGDHKYVLRSTILRFCNIYNDKCLQLNWPILQDAKMEPSKIESVIQIVDYEEKSEKEHEDEILQPVTLNICEDDKNIITSELQSDDEDSIYSFNTVLPESPTSAEYNIQPPEPYKKYSDMFKWDNLTDVEKISLISSIENLSVLHKEAEELNKSEVTLLNIFSAYGASNFSVIQSKLWVTELRQRFDDMKMYLNLHDMFKCDIINETVFDRTSVNLYEKYCKPIFNQKFVVITLHNLGKSLGNILFNIN